MLSLPRLAGLFFWLCLLPGRTMAQELPVERVSFTTDQEAYIAGDLLWLAAWCGQSFPTEVPLSTVLYVELLDGRGQSVMQHKLAIEAGRAHAGLDLPDLLPTGHYFLRAYTQHQRNFSPETYFTRVITILNPTLEPVPMSVPPEPVLSVRFENGQAVAGARNRLVARLVEPGCKVEDLRIAGPSGEVLAAPVSVFGDLALFELDMEEEAYTLICPAAGVQLELPRPLPGGFSAIVRKEAGKQMLVLSGNVPAQQESWQVQWLGPHFQPMATQTLPSNAGESTLTLEIPAGLLPGLHPLVVRNARGEILYCGACRFTEKAPAAELTLETGVAPRALSSARVLLPGTLSGAITARTAVSRPASHISEWLWLNPWLAPHLVMADGTMPDADPGAISEVLFSAYLREHLRDLGTAPEMRWPPESRDLSVSGLVRTSQTKEPVKNALVLLSVVGEYPQVHVQRTRPDGTFHLALRNLEGIETLYAGVQPMEGRGIELLVNRDFSEETPRIAPLPLRFDPQTHQHFESLWIGFQARQRWEKPASSPAYISRNTVPLPVNLGAPDVVVNVDDFIELPTMEEVFRNIVPKVTPTGEPGKRQLAVYEDLTMQSSPNPLVLLDYAAIFDIDALLKLPTSRLARVEVYQGNYVLGDHQFGGVVSLFTNTDDFARYPLDLHGSFVQFATRQAVNSFEVVTSPPAGHQPDLRSVQAWNPVITGKASLSWVHPDLPGACEVKLQACDDRGSCWTWRSSSGTE